MGRNSIKAIDENGNTIVYNSLQDAAKAIGSHSKMEDWKIQLFIAYALNTKTRAFKHKWVPAK
jgi:hypothetical protein